jgi:hypothetical protein
MNGKPKIDKQTEYLPAPATVEAETLREFTQLREGLSLTHSQIPALLANAASLRRQLGLAEAQGQDAAVLRESLTTTESGREGAARRRSAVLDRIMALEPALMAERAEAEKQQQAHAITAVAEFRRRYDGLVGQLQQMWKQGEALSRALRVPIPMPIPAKVITSVVDGVARLAPIQSNADAAPVLDAEAERLAARLDVINAALSLCNAIRQSRLLDQREYRLGIERGMQTGAGGVFVVKQPFLCMLDGLVFEPGMLVDAGLVGLASIARLQKGRKFIMPVELEAVAA